MPEEVIVTISPDGEKVDMDAGGFTGSKCTDLMKRTMKMLGTVEKMQRKPEANLQGGAGVKVGN